MGNITIQGDLTGDVPGGEVGGASNLTTVGAIPYVSATGTLNQDPTKLFWDATNKRLGVGTNAPSESIQSGAIRVLGQKTLGTGNPGLYLFTDTAFPYSASIASLTPGSNGNPLRIDANPLSFGNSFSGVEAARFAVTTNNLLIGTTTDSNFKLDVAASGSAGTARFYNQSTGALEYTQVLVRAALNQGNTPVFVVQDSGGSGVLTVNTGFAYTATSLDFGNGSRNAELRTTGFVTGSATPFKFSSTANSNGITDLSLSRASAGVLQVGDGGANANGTVVAAKVGVGTASPTYALHVVGGDIGIGSGYVYRSVDVAYFDSGATSPVNIRPGGGQAMRLFPTTLNVVLGPSPTDGNYKLDVQNSGSTGTLRVYDQTPTTGSTKAVIRAGAGQSTTNLTEWQNNAGTRMGSVGSSGEFYTPSLQVASGGSTGVYADNTKIEMKNTYSLQFSIDGNAFNTKDLGLARNAAGVLEIDSGTAGAYRDLILRRLQMGGQTVSQLPAAAAGNAGSTQYVTDATATTISSIVAGGGSNKVLVWSDGTNWKIMAS